MLVACGRGTGVCGSRRESLPVWCSSGVMPARLPASLQGALRQALQAACCARQLGVSLPPLAAQLPRQVWDPPRAVFAGPQNPSIPYQGQQRPPPASRGRSRRRCRPR